MPDVIDIRPRRYSVEKDYNRDVPTPAATLARARELLSPRAQAGLAALPAERQATTARAVASGEYLAKWDRHLSEGQSWPDVIEGTSP